METSIAILRLMAFVTTLAACISIPFQEWFVSSLLWNLTATLLWGSFILQSLNNKKKEKYDTKSN